MLYFKSCPRCGGDVNVDRDWYGEYKNCLQCGWSQDTSSDPLSSLAQNYPTPSPARESSGSGETAIKQAS